MRKKRGTKIQYKMNEIKQDQTKQNNTYQNKNKYENKNKNKINIFRSEQIKRNIFKDWESYRWSIFSRDDKRGDGGSGGEQVPTCRMESIHLWYVLPLFSSFNFFHCFFTFTIINFIIFIKILFKIFSLIWIENSCFVNVNYHFYFLVFLNSFQGRKWSEWDKLASWFFEHKLAHENVRWLIQIPRLYHIYRHVCTVQLFRVMIEYISLFPFSFSFSFLFITTLFLFSFSFSLLFLFLFLFPFFI